MAETTEAPACLGEGETFLQEAITSLSPLSEPRSMAGRPRLLPDDQPSTLQRLFAHSTHLVTARLAPYADLPLAPFATAVLALDETSLDRVGRLLPALRGAPARDDRLRPGKLAALVDRRRQVWRHVVYVPAPPQNEKKTAPTLLPQRCGGLLVVMDWGSFSFAWVDTLTAQGVFWVSRLRQQTRYAVIHTFYAQGETRDWLVWLGG